MAKEMMIVFVYDTLACTGEHGDPAEAVLYFHPGWVSDTQRHALAGQVVGTAHCVKSLFSQPLAISLQSGKFILREYGRYILAIGSDRNIPDWVLKNRATLLTSMIRVYHGDLHTIASLYEGRQKFADKLYQIFETYLPVLQYGCHIFQRVPILTLPKSATSVYLEAMQVLDHCSKMKGVLGGVILYNNKIIASQLPPGLTSYLTVVDPYRIKSPAERLATEAPPPLAAQLLTVYVGTSSYEALKRRNAELQAMPGDVVSWRKHQEDKDKFPPIGMKRDKSLLFTAVPEEDQTMISPPTHDANPDDNRKPPNIPDVVPFTNRPRQRPTKLSLSFKNQKSLEEEVKEDATEKVFTGQTSVCSTPMVEYKRLHGNVLSICQNPDVQLSDKNPEPDVLKNIENSAKNQMLENEKRDNRLLFEFNGIGEHYVNKPEPMRKLASVTNIQDSYKSISNRAIAKFKLKSKIEDDSPENVTAKNMTINDPSFPVFRNDGVAISESLFNQYMEEHYASKKQDLSDQENMFTFNMKLCDQEKFEGFDSEMMKSPQRTPKKVPKDLKINPSINQTDQSRRKSLSLPLKSLNDSEGAEEGTSFKKKLSGVQLTPLMEKLSHLAFSDKSSGYSSRVMTPLELRDFSTPAVDRQATFTDRSKPPAHRIEADDDAEVPLARLADYSSHSQRAGLFVSGLQNCALLVLLEEDAVNESLVARLWDTALNALGPIEQKCMEPFPTDNDSTDHSYLVLDPDWGTVKKGGPWRSLDIATMGLLHSDLFSEDEKLTECVLRSEEAAVAAVRVGGAESYLAASGGRPAGPPPPTDLLARALALAASTRHSLTLY